jgi:hypothetical protein
MLQRNLHLDSHADDIYSEELIVGTHSFHYISDPTVSLS